MQHEAEHMKATTVNNIVKGGTSTSCNLWQQHATSSPIFASIIPHMQLC